MMRDLDQRAQALRREFDLSFARPLERPAPDTEDLLAIRCAGAPYAVRLLEIAELAARRKVVPIPSANPHLIGLAGIRGALVPVFGLASLLGLDGGGAPARWLMLCRGSEPIALAFDDFEGHLRIERGAMVAAGGVVRPLIDIALLAERLQRKHKEP